MEAVEQRGACLRDRLANNVYRFESLLYTISRAPSSSNIYRPAYSATGGVYRLLSHIYMIR